MEDIQNINCPSTRLALEHLQNQITAMLADIEAGQQGYEIVKVALRKQAMKIHNMMGDEA